MNILKKLSKKNLFLNKKRTIVTIIGIILSGSLISAVSGMFTSMQKTIVQNAINETGYYHIELFKLDDNDIKKLNANRDIKEIKFMYDLGYSHFIENEEMPFIHIYSTEKIDELSYHIIDGRKPNNENEIILNKKALQDSNYKIGDTITLEVGKRTTKDGYELDDSNPYYEENEEQLINTTKKTYKIVGTFKKSGYNYNYYGITTKEKSDNIIGYASLTKPSDYEKSLLELLGINNFTDISNAKYKYEINNELLRWEVFAFSDSTISMLYAVASVVIGIIIITSIFCIRNSFAIGVTEKTKMIGMLSSIGATKKQIKKGIIYEALILGFIGIPLGIVSGILAVFVLIKIVNTILNGVLFENLDHIIFHITIIPLIFSCILGFLTIYLSALIPAIKASKKGPIENLKNSESLKINPKKLKKSKLIDKVFGIGGTLAHKNLQRSKKKYRTTVISLTISIFVFISMNTFITESFNFSSKYYEDYDYNMEIHNASKLKEEDLRRIKNIEGVTNAYILYEINGYLELSEKDENNYVNKSLFEECYINESGKEICEYLSSPITIIALDDEFFKTYTKKLKLDNDRLEREAILNDEYKEYIDSKEVIVRSYKYKDNDTINGKIGDKDIQIKLAKVASIKPNGIENSYNKGGFLILNKKYYNDLNFTPSKITIESDNPSITQKELEKLSSDLIISNFEEAKKNDASMKLIISIFLYGFITVITLIGVTNIFNTITANMELRKKEFAMLKSIGMTKKEFNRMINLETFFYSTKSLVYGIILGLIGSLLIHEAFSKKNDINFIIPYTPIVLSILFVFLLVFIIMRFSINKINKQNIIETIRKDNI